MWSCPLGSLAGQLDGFHNVAEEALTVRCVALPEPETNRIEHDGMCLVDAIMSAIQIDGQTVVAIDGAVHLAQWAAVVAAILRRSEPSTLGARVESINQFPNAAGTHMLRHV